jgi:hypothetical protein
LVVGLVWHAQELAFGGLKLGDVHLLAQARPSGQEESPRHQAMRPNT